MDATCLIEDCEDGHMGLKANQKVHDRLLEIGAADSNTKFVLSHFSHNGKLLYDEIVAEAQKFGATASFDGMIVEI